MGLIFPKGESVVLNRKNKHHHRIWHIRISLGTKFHLKHKILKIWMKRMFGLTKKKLKSPSN